MGRVPYIWLQGKATVKLQQFYFSRELKLIVAAIMGAVPYILLHIMATVKL
jgi:hypothetical protein